MTRLFFVVFLLLYLAGEKVLAANVSAMNPPSLVRALQDAGYRASLTKTENGTQIIDTATAGNPIRIMLMDYGSAAKHAEFVGYWDCTGRMKECIRNAQKFNDEESPVKAIPFPELNQVGVCYYVLFDAAGISASLFVLNLEMFSVYNQKFARMFD